MSRFISYILIFFLIHARLLSQVATENKAAADAAAVMPGWIAIFGTADCEDCAMVKKQWEEQWVHGQDPVLLFLNVEHTPNYHLLTQLETILAVPDKGQSFPIFLAGNKFIVSMEEMEFQADLFDLAARPLQLPETAILNDSARTATQAVISIKVPAQNDAKIAADDASTTIHDGDPPSAPPQLLYFYQKNCRKCSRQEKELELLNSQLPELQVTRFDVATLDGLVMLRRARQQFDLSDESTKNLAPMVCWSTGYISGGLATAEELQQALQENLKPQVAFWRKPVSASERQTEKSMQRRRLGWAAVGLIISAGLIDGFNPCAFASSIFLLGYLLYLKRRPREIALVGAAFCLGVFITYVLLGLGLFFLLDYLHRWHWLKATVYSTFGILGLLLAIGHARDAWRYRQSGRAADMDLGLSRQEHVRIHNWIKRLTERRTWLMAPAALALGAIVSGLELACTGQIYLPTLAAINADGIDLRAFLLLLLYNVFFLLPLVGITVLTVSGVGAKPVAAWAQRHVFGTKIAMAILFAGLAVLMFSLI